jgi:hypothetical protein
MERNRSFKGRKQEQKSHVVGQYGLYLTRTGSKPISPIPTTMPMRQMFDLVVLNDIQSLS